VLFVIFSDIHANIRALEAVLEDMEREKPDVRLCLGDLVGYGVELKEVVDRVRGLDCP
jgi:predicted phosphodiesterase